MDNAPATVEALAFFAARSTLQYIEIGRSDGADDPCPATVDQLMRAVGRIPSLTSLALTANVQGATWPARIFFGVVQGLVSEHACHSLQSIHLSITGNGDVAVAQQQEVELISPWQLLRLPRLQHFSLKAHVSVTGDPHADVLESALDYRLRQATRCGLLSLALDLRADRDDTRFLAWVPCLVFVINRLAHPLMAHTVTSFALVTNISLVRVAGRALERFLLSAWRLEHLAITSYPPPNLPTSLEEQLDPTWLRRVLDGISFRASLVSLCLRQVPLGYVQPRGLLCTHGCSRMIESSVHLFPLWRAKHPASMFFPCAARSAQTSCA